MIEVSGGTAGLGQRIPTGDRVCRVVETAPTGIKKGLVVCTTSP